MNRLTKVAVIACATLSSSKSSRTASRRVSIEYASVETRVADCSGDLITRLSATERLAVARVRVGDCG